MRSPVAILELLATSGDGKSFPLRATVGAPEFVDAPDTYSCDVEMSLFDSPLRPVQGEGSFQALCLALRLVLHLLAAFVQRGGTLRHPDGEEVDLEAFAIGNLFASPPDRLDS